MKHDTQITNDSGTGLSRQPIILDCDGVLLDWTRGFRTFLESRGHQVSGDVPTRYDMTDWINLPKKEIVSHILDFNNTPDSGFGGLMPAQGAVEAVRMMAGSGRELVVLTLATDVRECIELRRENLVRVFGDVFSDIICLPIHESKESWLNSFDATDFVEDLPANAIIGMNCGHRSHLVRRPYNSDADVEGTSILVHDSLQDVAKFITTPGPVTSGPEMQI